VHGLVPAREILCELTENATGGALNDVLLIKDGPPYGIEHDDRQEQGEMSGRPIQDLDPVPEHRTLRMAPHLRLMP
jgi:hypothetical protein